MAKSVRRSSWSLGSGPTDRDWCSPLLPGTNGSAKLLAESLAARGFLTLRYDKLASGPLVKKNLQRFSGKLSMQTHLDELAGAVDVALSEKNLNEDGLLALTNSEGAIHAVNYQLQAKRNRFKGLVLTGAPGRAIGTVARWPDLQPDQEPPRRRGTHEALRRCNRRVPGRQADGH